LDDVGEGVVEGGVLGVAVVEFISKTTLCGA